jgi:hypothetical protein
LFHLRVVGEIHCFNCLDGTGNGSLSNHLMKMRWRWSVLSTEAAKTSEWNSWAIGVVKKWHKVAAFVAICYAITTNPWFSATTYYGTHIGSPNRRIDFENPICESVGGKWRCSILWRLLWSGASRCVVGFCHERQLHALAFSKQRPPSIHQNSF